MIKKYLDFLNESKTSPKLIKIDSKQLNKDYTLYNSEKSSSKEADELMIKLINYGYKTVYDFVMKEDFHKYKSEGPMPKDQILEPDGVDYDDKKYIYQTLINGIPGYERAAPTLIEFAYIGCLNTFKDDFHVFNCYMGNYTEPNAGTKPQLILSLNHSNGNLKASHADKKMGKIKRTMCIKYPELVNTHWLEDYDDL